MMNRPARTGVQGRMAEHKRHSEAELAAARGWCTFFAPFLEMDFPEDLRLTAVRQNNAGDTTARLNRQQKVGSRPAPPLRAACVSFFARPPAAVCKKRY